MLLTAVSALGILLAGCGRDSGSNGDSEIGTLKITINSEARSTGRATGIPSNTMENEVHSFAVCVFHNVSGTLEAFGVFKNTLTGEIQNLQSSFSKRVVVLVNGDYDALENLSDYTQLQNALFSIETQDPDNLDQNGLFMSGEATDVELEGGETTTATIDVRRVVAKVNLNSVTVSPDEFSSLSKFKLLGVSMQRVPHYAFPVGTAMSTLGDYRGGLAGEVSTLIPTNPDLLYTEYAPTITQDVALSPQIYFYVFPNDDSDGNPTLLTLYGTYDNQDAYYTVVVNDPASVGTGNTTDGTYVRRNMIYSLNVTLKRLSSFSDDPDRISDRATLEVTVNVLNWEGDLIQNVEW